MSLAVVNDSCRNGAMQSALTIVAALSTTNNIGATGLQVHEIVNRNHTPGRLSRVASPATRYKGLATFAALVYTRLHATAAPPALAQSIVNGNYDYPEPGGFDIT